MYELTYNPNYLTNDYELGFTTDDGYLWMLNEDKTINQQFVEFLNGIQSFRLLLTTGTATCRFERGKHWYAYKKVRGKLNKAYIGKSTDFTDLLLNNVVASINIDKSDQPSKAIAKKSKPKSEPKLQTQSVTLAGHGKDDRLIQVSIPEIIPDDWNPEAERWKRIAATYQKSCEDLGDTIRGLRDELQSLKYQQLSLDCEEQLLSKQLTIDALEAENILLQDSLNKEKENYRTLDATYSDFRFNNAWLKAEVDVLKDRLDKTEKELKIAQTERENIEFVLRNEEKRNSNLRQEIFRLQGVGQSKRIDYGTVIEEFRLLAKGKDKRNHPRFAYLLDFLARIDNLS